MRFEEAERLFREAGDEHAVAATLNHLSWSMYLTGEPTRAIALAEEALEVHERFGDVRGIALAHNNLGWVRFYHRGELAQAREHLESALARPSVVRRPAWRRVHVDVARRARDVDGKCRPRPCDPEGRDRCRLPDG